MKRIFVILAIVGIVIFSLVFYRSSTTKKVIQNTPEPISQTEDIEIKASFTIRTNGTLRIFTDPKYHNRSEIVYIAPDSSSTVVVKKTGVTWNDFFITLPMSLDSNCLTTGTGQTFCTDEKGDLLFYINGVLDPDALSKPINEGDKLFVDYKRKS